MSLLKGLNVIAVTDHNTMKNCESVRAVAQNTDLLVIPGMEIQTREDVHIVALFPSLNAGAAVEKLLDEHRLMLPHRPEKFGHQSLMDNEDHLKGEYPITLLASIDLGIDEIIKEVMAQGGVVFPAHINKPGNSVLANLGFIPEDWPIAAVEIFKPDENQNLITKYKASYKVLRNSDAHYLMDISEAENSINLPALTIEEVLKYLGEFKEKK